MNPKQWQQIEQIYHAALEHPPENRAAFLTEACADDLGLRQEVEALLRHDSEAQTFMQDHALNVAAQQFDSEDVQTTQVLLTGQQLGAYKILSLLGKGGMGEVHLALDTRLQRKVALKLLPAPFTQNHARVRRFEQEARAASALNHPNILTIHEIGEHEHLHYIVTEFVEGETLRQRMKSPLARSTTIAIVAQVAEALAAAHEAGIIHRDIKPENVMVRTDGYVKVLDFGLAKLTRDEGGGMKDESEKGISFHPSSFIPHPSTIPGLVMGTPRYMSPEQACGERVDARTDIFSLGVMLYEMVAGRAPFAGKTSGEVIASILRDEPAPLPDAAPELQQLLQRSLQKERTERYATMRELLIDLKRLQRQLERQQESLTIEEKSSELQPQSVHSDEHSTSPLKLSTTTQTILTRPRMLAMLAIIGLVVVGSAAWFYFQRTPALTAKDTILLADFDNKTGDEVFDGMLRQGLAIQLKQTPFLTLFPEAQTRHQLTLMKRAPNERVTAELARQICERQNLKAFIAGSIAPLGNHFVIALEAINGQSGESLARTQAQASGKEQVLQSLSQAATDLRRQLGESLSSIQRFDRSLQEGTTANPDAFNAYAQGIDLAVSGRLKESLPFFHRAVELDREFAHAYSQIGIMYWITGQPERGGEYAKKSYELKDRAGEIERSRIVATYHRFATGNLEKAIEVMTLHRHTFPREFVGPNDLALSYSLLGQDEPMMTEARISIGLNPRFAGPYRFAAIGALHNNRFTEAKAALTQALAQNLDTPNFHPLLYQIAFVENDASGMQQQIAWAKGRAEEHIAYDWQAASSAFAGRWREAQELTRQAMQTALLRENREIAARFAVEQALRSAVLGDCRYSRASVTQGLGYGRGRLPLSRAALALALCGESKQSQSLMTELAQRFPEDTLMHSLWLPMIRAAMELQRNNARQAIDQLQATSRYETAAELWPQYLRGQAYLQLKQNAEAAAEFQKILDHRGYAPISLLYPLAQLELARATQNRKAYDEFFAAWKDADADLPILLAARKEALGK